jgi:hypothetical protein
MGCLNPTTQNDLYQMRNHISKGSAAPAADNEFVQTAAFLSKHMPSIVPQFIKSSYGNSIRDIGKMGEQVAEKVLEQELGLKIVGRTNSQGPDLKATAPGFSDITVEVKTSIQEKSFSQLLGRGYGHKQCSDGWLKSVNVDPSQTKVLGVHIDPDKGTATIYQRLDAEAHNWRVLMKDISLAQLDL